MDDSPLIITQEDLDHLDEHEDEIVAKAVAAFGDLRNKKGAE